MSEKDLEVCLEVGRGRGWKGCVLKAVEAVDCLVMLMMMMRKKKKSDQTWEIRGIFILDFSTSSGGNIQTEFRCNPSVDQSSRCKCPYSALMIPCHVTMVMVVSRPGLNMPPSRCDVAQRSKLASVCPHRTRRASLLLPTHLPTHPSPTELLCIGLALEIG